MVSAKSKKIGQRPLRRKTELRRPKKTLVIFCEGQRSEPEYFDALKTAPQIRDNASIEIRIDSPNSGSVPLTLVQMAKDARQRTSADEYEIDEFWCVFDVEWPKNHPNLQQAMSIAIAHSINLAISNPCFELWLALHFRACSQWLDNSQARRLRRTLDGSSGKAVPSSTYASQFETAARHAKALDARHHQNGVVFPRNNPSSGMHKIIDSVLE